MKRILFSTLVIAVFALIVSSGTVAFFRDQEAAVGNTYTAGTIDIAVNGEDHWSGNFVWDDIKPGRCFTTTMNIENTGDNPLRLWKVIKCLETGENGIIEPEQAWYDANPEQAPKNDIDAALTYEMHISGHMAVNHEAGITVSQIKNHYIGLLPIDPGDDGSKVGILSPDESLIVEQEYCMPEDVGNWAQSDQMTFVLELYAQQTDMPDPLPQIAFYDNKFPGWNTNADEALGLLKYEYQGPELVYDFYANGMADSREMCLIYYRDSDSNRQDLSNLSHVLIAKGFPVGGELQLNGQKDVGGDLPYEQDANYPFGAKIWLVTCDQYNEINDSLTWSNMNYWLFDNWPGLINYRQGERPDFQHNCEYDEAANDGQNGQEPLTVYLNQLGGDIEDQYGYQHDYSMAAANNVSLTYSSPMNSKFNGVMGASGLKPYATYQVKLVGVPICQDPVNGDDAGNELIGYKGRWTCTDCTCSGAGCNRTDADYEAYSDYQGDGSQCIAGYLVLDYFTADSNGDILPTETGIYGHTSYHVLWCSGGVCDTGSPNDFAAYGAADPAHPGVQFCQPTGVNGEAQSGRGGCGGLDLDTGAYDLKIVLTEESFHQGNWATVLEGDIGFEVE